MLMCKRVISASCRQLGTAGRPFTTAIATRSGDSSDETNGPSSGWYSPRSIEARVSIPRKRPSGVTVPRSTRPPKSEEDAYLEAGAYAYGAAAARTEGAQPLPAAKESAPSDAQPSTGNVRAKRTSKTKRAAASDSASVGGDAAVDPAAPSVALPGLYDMFSRDASAFPVVRVSTGRVPVSSLAAFIRSFQLSAAPAYRGVEGCLSAALWIAGLPADAAPADISTSALTSRAGGAAAAVERARKARETAAEASEVAADSVEVRAVTVWRDAASLDAVIAGSAGADASESLRTYKSAMTALAPYFSEAPTSEVLRQAQGWYAPGLMPSAPAETTGRRSSKAKASNLSDAATVGPELGLR